MAPFQGPLPFFCPRPNCIWRALHLEFEIPFTVSGSRLLQIAHVVSPNSEIGAGEKGK